MNNDINILVIKKDSVAPDGISVILKKQNCFFMEVAGGSDGLKNTIRIKPDLIFLNADLPDMSLNELFDKIRTNSNISDSYIIIVSPGANGDNRRPEILNNRVDDYISSSAPAHELNARIASLIKMKRMEKALISAKEKAMEASNAKIEFLASMSHELRTPLNAVIGFSELISEKVFGDLNEKQYEYMKIVWKSAKHLQVLIDDILDYIKMEAGEVQLNPSAVNIYETIEAVVNEMHRKAEMKEIDIKIIVEEKQNLSGVHADAGIIKQILMNLLSNSIKFTQTGGAVEIEAWKTNAHLWVAVTDTGVGFDPNLKNNLFSPFFQVSDIISGKPPGTGLGLSICRKLIGIISGSIDCHSSGYGKGSSFTLKIPISCNHNHP